MSQPTEAAIAANDAGVELADARRYADALPFYDEASRLAPDWYAVHLNVGIACKHTTDWTRSLAGSLRAFELDPARAGDTALWNAGVAATALGDWTRARWAWTKLGIPVPEGAGPIDMRIGTTPIRVNTAEKPEVVWCYRLDPARARIESIPTPDSGRRYHDLLLHDGEPRGKRRYGDEVLSVFDELAVLETSSFQTWSVEIVAPTEADVRELFRSIPDDCDAALEDWTASLEILCKQCSEGLPHEHAPDEKRPWSAARTIGVATSDEAVFALIHTWADSRRGRAASAPVRHIP
jgi:hypothetical protein